MPNYKDELYYRRIKDIQSQVNELVNSYEKNQYVPLIFKTAITQENAFYSLMAEMTFENDLTARVGV